MMRPAHRAIRSVLLASTFALRRTHAWWIAAIERTNLVAAREEDWDSELGEQAGRPGSGEEQYG